MDLNTYTEETENIDRNVIIGQNLFHAFADLKETGILNVLKRVNKTGITEIYNSHLYVDTGTHGWRKNEVLKLQNGDIMLMYQDITKEKALEKKLKAVTEFIENSQTIVFFWKAEDGWPVEYLSENISAFGYVKNDFLSNRLKYQDIIHKDDIDRVYKEVEQYTKDKIDNFTQIYRILTADGEIRWVDDRTLVKRDKYGVVLNYLGTITDITQARETQSKLKESEEQFHAIAENSLMGIFIYQDTYKYVNPAIVNMLEYSVEELSKMSPIALVEDKMKPLFKRLIKRRLKGERFPKNYSDVRFFTKNGTEKIVRMMTETIEYKGAYAGLGTIIDITDMKKTSNKLKMLAQAIEQTDELVMITDKDGVITYVNDAYIVHSGYKRTELINKKANIVKSNEQSKEFYTHLWEVISSGETYSNVIINSRKDHEIYHLETTITPILDSNNKITSFVSTSKDITQRMKMQKELTRRANFDNLTNTYNRYSGNEILDSEIDKFQRYESSFALIMLDIDYFKTINDTYGHDVGDTILIQLTQLIKMHMRKSDHIIRWGGEEFVIISEHLDAVQAKKFAVKLKDIISSYEFENNLSITVSFGVSVVESGDTKHTILKRVDDALYHAKRSGRNCVEFI